MTTLVTTPVKPKLSPNNCLFCLSTCRRVYCLNHVKAVRDNYIYFIQTAFATTIPFSKLENLYICEPCAKTCKHFSDFKDKYAANLQAAIETSDRQKRMAKTPPSALKKKVSVADQLTKSVKRLKELELGRNEGKKSGRKLHFDGTDHPYSKPEIATALPRSTKDQIPLIEKKFDLIQGLHDEYLKTINSTLQSVSKQGNSILFQRHPSHLYSNNWYADIVEEMESKCPDLLHVLVCAIGKRIPVCSKMATIATIYGMLVHCRNSKASALQRLYTALAIRYHADNKLLKRMNEVHITLSDESKRHIIKECAEYSEESIIKEIASGKDGKINGDNLDIYVTTNDIRMKNTNKDYHFFASDWTADRVNLTGLNNETSLCELPVTHALFIPSLDETKTYRESLKVLLGRIMVEYLDGFHWMGPVIADHIEHDFQDVMSLKSSVHWMGVLLKNEASYSDCVQIMAHYEQLLTRWYTKAGRGGELQTLQVPVGGDQLTRVRLQGAKALRAGSLTAQDRLDHLYPVIMEMFHTLQDFLEKLYKRFYKTSSGRDEGTLQNLKILLQRSNVNGNVKSRFKANEDFVLTVGCGYFLTFILKKFHMEHMNDEPKHSKLKKNLKMMHNDLKKNLFDNLMDEIVDSLLQVYTDEEKKVTLRVTTSGSTTTILCQPKDDICAFIVSIDGERYTINVTTEQARNGASITFNSPSGLIQTIKIDLLDDRNEADDLHNYVKNFMQWYFLILNFKDTVKEGDIQRNNINLKMCIPFFYSHSALSKYFTDCIDYILKTEAALTEKLALKVRCSSFVNLKGKKGKNKAADLQKENQILVMKELIRGLGANKTENAIVNVTKAAPVIQNISENIDRNLGIKNKETRHKKRSNEDDINVLLSKLVKLDPWTRKNGREFIDFRTISDSPFSFDNRKFKDSIMQNVTRLSRGVHLLGIDEESEET